jgi:prophage maintenance system killer protein
MAGFDLLAAALRSSSPQAHSARSSNALLPFCEAFSNYIEGYQRLADLDTAWERSVLAMFVVSEVHPFDDGNGRVARIMMNAEL